MSLLATAAEGATTSRHMAAAQSSASRFFMFPPPLRSPGWAIGLACTLRVAEVNSPFTEGIACSAPVLPLKGGLLGRIQLAGMNRIADHHVCTPEGYAYPVSRCFPVVLMDEPGQPIA